MEEEGDNKENHRWVGMGGMSDMSMMVTVEMNNDIEMMSPSPLMSPMIPAKRRRQSEMETEQNVPMPPPPPPPPIPNNEEEVFSEGQGAQEVHSQPPSRPSSSDRVNPFELHWIKNVKGFVCSPGMFSNVSTSSTPASLKNNKEFTGWNIHELAHLWPKNLEGSPSSHTNPYPLDPSLLAQVDNDIETFFNKGPIIPTPDDVPKNKRSFAYRSPGQPKAKADSWTNTELSLPAELPPELEQALAHYSNVDCCSETTNFNTSVNVNLNGSYELECETEQVSSQGSNGSFRGKWGHVGASRRLDFSSCDGSSGGPGTPLSRSRPSTADSNIGGDPFCDNHEIRSPCKQENLDLDISTGELELQFARHQFTPTSKDKAPFFNSPDITPIRGGQSSQSSSGSGNGCRKVQNPACSNS